MILCVFLAKTAPGFLTKDNLLDVLSNLSVEGMVALGMTIVIICGEIDLSVGSGAAWSACWMAWLVQILASHHVNMPLTIALAGLAAIATGALIGTITGWLRVWFSVPTFITTLAWFTILRSGAKLITGRLPDVALPGVVQLSGQRFCAGRALSGHPVSAGLLLPCTS